MLDFVNDFPENTVRYAIYQHEIGKEGTPHFQGYIQLYRSQRMGFLKTYLPKAHLEPQRAKDDKQAADYCKKNDATYLDGPWEYGHMDTNQGQRTDLEEACDAISKGMDTREFAQKFPVLNVKYNKNFKSHRMDLEEILLDKPDIILTDWQNQVMDIIKSEPVKRRIIWIWSEASKMGKSTFKDYIYSLYPDMVLEATKTMSDTLYLYRGHSIIWFDNAREDPVDSTMVAQLEKYSDGGLMTSTKYEPRRLVMKSHIIVTSNKSPPYHRLPERIVEIKAIL